MITSNQSDVLNEVTWLTTMSVQELHALLYNLLPRQQALQERKICSYVWQSWIEIKYFVAYFEHITQFDALEIRDRIVFDFYP